MGMSFKNINKINKHPNFDKDWAKIVAAATS